jgi:hypothetical protein
MLCYILTCYTYTILPDHLAAGSELETGSEEASKEGGGPLAKVPVIGETLEEINPLK